jgi:protein gp37
MAKDSKIEWTHHTFNPWWGCERVSAACKNCYAETWAHRLGLDLWRKGAPRRIMSDEYWRQPLKWNKEVAAVGRRDRVFCASMADVFEDRADLSAPRERLWRLIAQTPNLDWLLLTKRPQHVGALVPWSASWPDNVWLGTTVENQRWAQKRIPLLLEQPAKVLFLSCEPLLGPLNLVPWLAPANGRRTVNWIITGGESGHRARPMSPDWARALRDQCEAFRVPFLFKQWGNWAPVNGPTNGHAVRQLPGTSGGSIQMANTGKKAAGRVLDGQQWDGVPCIA